MYDLRKELGPKLCIAQGAAIPRSSPGKTLSHSVHCSFFQAFYLAPASALPSSPFLTTPGVTGQRLKPFRNPESM